MNPVEVIDERVDVAVVYKKGGDITTLACPKKMVHRGREIAFTKLGMRHPTEQGKRMIHVFDMSDGVNDYRLEFDAERLTWTLVSMIAGSCHE
jgi:hypothetical protein